MESLFLEINRKLFASGVLYLGFQIYFMLLKYNKSQSFVFTFFKKPGEPLVICNSLFLNSRAMFFFFPLSSVKLMVLSSQDATIFQT